MPAVALIIPARNAQRWIPRLMASIRLQTFRDLEVIVVDDASTDDTAASFVRHAGSTALRVLHHEVRRGPAAGRNLAIRTADCRWVAVVDADDLMHPQRIEHLTGVASSTGAQWVADQQLWFGGDPPQPVRVLLAGQGMPVENRGFVEALLLRCGVQGRDCGNLAILQPLVERAAVERHSLWYDESLSWCEDLEWSLRCALAGLRLGWSPEPDYYYQMQAAGARYGDRAALMDAAHKAIGATMSGKPDFQPALAQRSRDIERSMAFVDALAGGAQALRRLRPSTLACNLWWRGRNKARVAMLRPSAAQRRRFQGAWQAIEAEMRP